VAISFTKLGNGTISVDFSGSQNTGDIETMTAQTAGVLFADTATPKVGDLIRFGWDLDPSESAQAGVKRQGQDVPRTIRFVSGQYVFAVCTGVAEYIVTAVDQSGALTLVRGDT
jgi:hypothetical protein